jgi:hypothetical protein
VPIRIVIAVFAGVVLIVVLVARRASIFFVEQQSGNADPGPAASADFVTAIENEYFPLRPGTTFLYRGTEEGRARRVSIFVTHKTRKIVGIRGTVVLDRVLVDGKRRSSAV